MEESKTLTVQQQQNQVRTINFFGGVEIFKEGWNMASILANSDLVPQHFKGKKENCLIALNMSQRMQADPLMVMQNLVVVKGTPTFEAKFAIACFNATGKYSPIRYREVGEKGKDNWGYVAYAIEKSTGEVCEGPEVTIGTAKTEGWYNQNVKWKNIPELMLRYRAASWFIRTTDPGVIMGFQTKEEVEDFSDFEEIPLDNGSISAPSNVPSDANTETVDMPENAEVVNGDGVKSNDGERMNIPEDTTPESTAPIAEPASQSAGQRQQKAQPLGKQQTPDIFGGK